MFLGRIVVVRREGEIVAIEFEVSIVIVVMVMVMVGIAGMEIVR